MVNTPKSIFHVLVSEKVHIVLSYAEMAEQIILFCLS